MVSKVKMGDELGRGWNLYKSNFGLLLGATFMTVLLSGLTCGILAGPMCCGLFMIIDALSKEGGERPTFGMLFNGFTYFGSSLCSWFVLTIVCAIAAMLVGMVPVIGWLAAFVINLLSSCMIALSYLFIVHRKMKGMEAVKEVLRLTFNGELTNFYVAAIVIGIISSLGMLLCGIGLLFTLPIYYAAVACVYRTAFGSTDSDAAQA